MQSHDKNNKCNHICFVTHSYSHTIPMNIWERGQQEEQETPFNVAADDSYRINAVKIFLYHVIDIYCLHLFLNVSFLGTCRVQENYAYISFSDFPKLFFCDMC